MNRRQSLLAFAAAALYLPHFLKANESKPFPLTRVKAGAGVYSWVEVYDKRDPEMRKILMVQEVNLDEGWIEQFETDGKHLIIDGDSFKLKRTYGDYGLRWRKTTEEEIRRSADSLKLAQEMDPQNECAWNEEHSKNGLTIPAGCIRATSVTEANRLAKLVLSESFA